MVNLCHPILNKERIYNGKALFFIGLNIDFALKIKFNLITGDLNLNWNSTGLWHTWCVDYLRYIGTEDQLLIDSVNIKDKLIHLAPPGFSPGTHIMSNQMPDYNINLTKYDYTPIELGGFNDPNSTLYNPRRWGIKVAMYNTSVGQIPGGIPYHPFEVYENTREVIPTTSLYSFNTPVGTMSIKTPTYDTKENIEFFLRGIGKGNDTTNITIILRYILDSDAKKLGILYYNIPILNYSNNKNFTPKKGVNYA